MKDPTLISLLSSEVISPHYAEIIVTIDQIHTDTCMHQLPETSWRMLPMPILCTPSNIFEFMLHVNS